MTLRHRIATLAEEFSLGILETIRSSSLEELLAAAPRGAGRAPPLSAVSSGRSGARSRGGAGSRRSPEQIAKVIDGIVWTLQEKPGLRSEDLQKLLSLPKNEITRPITLAFASGNPQDGREAVDALIQEVGIEVVAFSVTR